MMRTAKAYSGPQLAFAGGCLFISAYTAIVALALAFTGMCFEYCLWVCVGKDVPWYLDVLGGAVTAGIAFPAAVICMIARACGIHTPFFNV